jgi:NAD(P)H-dependent nitrite reductase small subunit
LNWIKVATTQSISADRGKSIDMDGVSIALFKVGDKIYAIDNVCPHKGGALAEGGLKECVVTCPWHGWKFDVTTGAMSSNPSIKVKSYPVKLQGSTISIQI